MNSRERSWSLVRRLRWWISMVATVPMLGAFLVGGAFLDRSIARETSDLLFEELEESMAMLKGVEDPGAEFPRISSELASFHPRTPMAWRLFDGSGRVIGTYGEIRLVGDDLPSATVSAPGEYREVLHQLTRTVAVGPDLRVGIVLDVSVHARFLGWFWLSAACLFLLAAGIGLFATHSLTRRVGSLFRQVADSVDGTEPRMRGEGGSGVLPPVEVQAVSDRITSAFARAREDSDRVRLFTAGLAHELRSPIQNLMAQAEVALVRDRDAEYHRKLLSGQLDEFSDLSDAVDNLLTICTIGSVPPPVYEEFDLAAEVQMRLVRESAKGLRKAVQLKISVHGDTLLAGDREHVLRGVRNVVANAIQWSPQSSTVEVVVEGLPGFVRVTVDDAGPGIPEAQRTQVFDAFAQGHRRGQERMGYGLGLAIARAAVEAHGGRIVVDTSPRGGARFIMTFQRSNPQ